MKEIKINNFIKKYKTILIIGGVGVSAVSLGLLIRKIYISGINKGLSAFRSINFEIFTASGEKIDLAGGRIFIEEFIDDLPKKGVIDTMVCGYPINENITGLTLTTEMGKQMIANFLNTVKSS